MAKELLPTGSGRATEALTETWDSRGRYVTKVSTIGPMGRTIFPDEWIPDLVQSNGLAMIVPYVNDFRRALTEGRIWKRHRGTDPAIEMGIRWVTGEGFIEPGDQRHGPFAFQIRFKAPIADVENIKKLDGITRISKSTVRDPAFRFFNTEHDIRIIRGDYHRWDEGSADGYSGMRLWPTGPLVSFGVHDIEYFDKELAAFEITEVAGTESFYVPIDLSEITGAEFTIHQPKGLPIGWPRKYPKDSWRVLSQSKFFEVVDNG